MLHAGWRPILNIFVIGASRGIGLEVVRQYLDAGDRVIATARDDASLQRLRDMGAQVLKLDVADPASVSGLSWALDGEKIDVALYVAGVYSQTGATTPPTQPEFDHVMHTNVLGAMQAIPQVAPWVEEARGKFAFITSGMGQIGEVESSFGWTYRVSKAALNMAVAAAQKDYAKATFIALCPGWVQTDMGGAGATLTVAQSVSAMRKTLSEVTNKDRGRFLHHDGRPYTSW
jgi:NAD(P)-dependent dehydrogenase (short-subunit alcohol dehydrogenase family)